MSTHFDIIIVGAGIAGVGLAAALPRGPAVAILEQEPRAAYHSTGRSAAIFIRNYGNAVIRALNAASAPLFERGDPTLFEHPLLTPRGVLNIADEHGMVQHAALIAGSEGLVELTPAEALALVPALRIERIAAAAYERDAQDIDVAALHEGWLRKARSNGAVIRVETPLLSAWRENDLWSVETSAGRLTAPILVNAAGAWADAVATASGVNRLGLVPMRRSMAVLPAPDGYDIRNWPLVADTAEGWYAKPDAGKLYVSPAEEIPVEPHDAFVDDMILAEGLDRFEQAFTFPVTRVERSWAGLRTFAPDRTPVAGFDVGAEGFFWLAGQGGYGIQTSPAMSALAAARITGAPPPHGLEGVVDALSPARFAR
ncbi:MAG: FAD-binding oxidoreductase [Mesorhizobium sp.]|nr:FAD-binding oxidoreductase [Mesorhizobium sp.]